MEKLILLFKTPDLRKKILIIAGILLVTRLFATIPIPGIDAIKLKSFFESNQLLGFLSVFSGGGLSTLSILMLGVSPYITATIIMQLLTMIFPSLKEIYYEQGEIGRAKFNRLSKYITVPLAALQAYGFLNLLASQQVIGHLQLFDVLRNVIIITAGSMFMVWLGDLISEQKLGNGVSLLIFAGIVSQLPKAMQTLFFNYNPGMVPTYIAFLLVSIIVIAGVVFVNEGERKIPISYSKQVRGNRVYGGVSSYLPLKVNQAGVIPIIFAISILLFPQFIAQTSALFSKSFSLQLNGLVNSFLGNPVTYSIFYFILVVIFTYFYTAVTFDPAEISKNLQRSGGFIPGIRPGEPSGAFLKKVINRITLFGAIFLGIIAILPNLTQIFTGIKALTVGGTALLIVVSVALESMKQINSQLVLREYEEL
ncbi:MAG: preprotein translocase subunit SecY [Parcubacteria group bacterium Athens0714_26]|nr:MAG: preprotein translocase subunit SecY [Parcubacteria group bacterium Athens1014_26]TSD03284.1 MAG: preprotein translocase subunit SecY [Parcubacteria group bacterium Athens0714_26]